MTVFKTIYVFFWGLKFQLDFCFNCPLTPRRKHSLTMTKHPVINGKPLLTDTDLENVANGANAVVGNLCTLGKFDSLNHNSSNCHFLIPPIPELTGEIYQWLDFPIISYQKVQPAMRVDLTKAFYALWAKKGLIILFWPISGQFWCSVVTFSTFKQYP